ncbi:hypothetical protein, partial [Klebsiella pneumoniae]|uniref:hypothetical protein n=1 Tax=Klebsiella pneumoniae TaxID=573 RepID=UPI003A812CAF
MLLEKDKDAYNNKEILKYTCVEPHNKIPGGEWICENGKWTGDFVCTSDICPPPPYVKDGSYISRNPDDKMPTEIYYECQ